MTTNPHSSILERARTPGHVRAKSAASKPRLSVVAVHYHQPELLAAMLGSIVRERAPFEVIVVNAGGDMNGAIPDGLHFPLRVVNRPNRGYAYACNEGTALASGEFVAVSNVDLEFTSGVLSAAVDYLDMHPEVGVAAPVLFNRDGSYQHSARRFYTWPVALWARCPLRSRVPLPSCFKRHLMMDEEARNPREIDWAIGALLFVRRCALKATGEVFDGRYRLYMEDVDLGWNMWQRGWKVMQVPALRVTHYHARRSKVVLSRAGVDHAMSFAKFILKHGGLPRRAGDQHC